MAKILVVDDEESIRITLSEFIRDSGHEVFRAGDVEEAFKLLRDTTFDVVVTDIIMPRITGVDLLKKIREGNQNIQVIMITGEPNVDTAVEAVRAGAFDYLSKPISKDEIRKVVGNAARIKELNEDKIRLEAENKEYQEHLEERVREQTRELQIKEKRYRTLFEESKDAIFISRRDGTLAEVNPAFLHLFGYEKDEIPELKSHDFYQDPSDRIRFQDLIEKEGSVRDFQVIFKTKEEKVIYCSITATVWLDDDDNVIGYQGMLRDITETKLIEKERKILEKTKSDFILLVSHELATPLMVIDYRLNSIAASIPTMNDDLKDDIESMYTNLKRLKDLKKAMSNLTFLEQGKFMPNKEPMFIQNVTEHLYDDIRFMIDEKQIELVSKTGDLGMIMADRKGIYEVMFILLDNAIRFTPTGGKIEVSGKEDDTHLQITVRDNGIGIHEEEQEKIFEKFYQIHDIMEHKEGYGLGLSVANGIIESHGGTIWVESQAMKGSKFHFRLPKMG